MKISLTSGLFAALCASSSSLLYSNAFIVTTPSHYTKNNNYHGVQLRAMPDSPSNWFQSEGGNSGDSYEPMFAPNRRGEERRRSDLRPYDPDGRAYYPSKNDVNNPPQPRMPQPRSSEAVGGMNQPDQWTPGPIGPQRRSGYGMETSDSHSRPRRQPPGQEMLQGGGTRKTWQTSHQDQTVVQIGSDGRPIYTRAQVWEGPNNTPASMTLYSEDGAYRPWNAGFQNTNRGGSGSSVLDLRNTGPVEFPVDVSVLGKHDGSKGMTKQQKDEIDIAEGRYQPSPDKVTQTVQGQSLKYFNVKAGVEAVAVELFSEGRPMYAQVELWQGPNSIKQCAEIYSDNGSDRVWNAVIETHGRECTVAVRNVGPALVYPFKASVDPIY